MGSTALPDIAGVWSGGRHVLTTSDTGLRLETDCARAEFEPPKPDSQGHFRVEGIHRADAAGPQRADDKAPVGQPAVLEGSLKDNRPELRLIIEGGAPQMLSLQRGRRVKLIRCL